MKFFFVDNGLFLKRRHNYNMALGFRAELARREIPCAFFINKRADDEIRTALQARPAFSHTPTDRSSADDLCAPLEDMIAFGRNLAREMQVLDKHGIQAGDAILFPYVLQNELYGCALWLRSLRKPPPFHLVINFFDENYLSPLDRRPRPLVAALYRYAARRLFDAPNGPNIVLTGPGERLCQSLTRLLQSPVKDYPLPQSYDCAVGEEAEVSPPRHDGPLDGQLMVSFFGASRSEKGFELIPNVVKQVRDLSDRIHFFIQVAPENTIGKWGAAAAWMRNAPNVTLHLGDMGNRAYLSALANSDIILLPYHPKLYFAKASGPFAEALAHGKVVVVPHGTWMAGQIERGHGAGAMFDAFDAESVARALRRAVDQYDGLRRKAEGCRDAWRKAHSVESYVDKLLAELTPG